MIILGLGSNKGERMTYLREAVARLSGFISGLRESSIYESKALLPSDAPTHWDSTFLNMAISGESMLSPEALLAELKSVERLLGRKAAGVWSPREIDIDILAIEGLEYSTSQLNIPHRELLNRDFALLPLVELAPNWRYPCAGEYHGMRAQDIAQAKSYRCGATLAETGIRLYGH